jgi:hypothetical protein
MGALAELIEVEDCTAVVASALELRLIESPADPAPRGAACETPRARSRSDGPGAPGAGRPRHRGGARWTLRRLGGRRADRGWSPSARERVAASGPGAEHPENRSTLCADGSVGVGAIGGARDRAASRPAPGMRARGPWSDPWMWALARGARRRGPRPGRGALDLRPPAHDVHPQGPPSPARGGRALVPRRRTLSAGARDPGRPSTCPRRAGSSPSRAGSSR